jgi:hypothetical protein
VKPRYKYGGIIKFEIILKTIKMIEIKKFATSGSRKIREIQNENRRKYDACLKNSLWISIRKKLEIISIS